MARTRIVMDESGMAQLQIRADEEAVHPITDEVAADMRRYVPVLSGDLLGTIHEEHLPGEGRVHFGNVDEGVDYHLYQEYGTANMAAQPYARPALFKERTL